MFSTYSVKIAVLADIYRFSEETKRNTTSMVKSNPFTALLLGVMLYRLVYFLTKKFPSLSYNVLITLHNETEVLKDGYYLFDRLQKHNLY